MWIIVIVVVLAAALWLGLRVKPTPFPAYAGQTALVESVPLPDNLPVPVARYFKAAVGDRIPVVHSAVISGTGSLKFQGVTFHSRWRFIHDAGYGYRHYIETTLFGMPLLKVNEWYLDGKSRLELPFGIVGQGAKTDTAAALGLWAESVWLPTVFITDPRVRWEAMDDTHARLVIPSGDGEDSLTITFDPQTGLMSQIEALRWRDEKSIDKILWSNHISGWRAFHGIRVPSPTAITWQDQGFAWFTPVVEDVAYNVDVSASCAGAGCKLSGGGFSCRQGVTAVRPYRCCRMCLQRFQRRQFFLAQRHAEDVVSGVDVHDLARDRRA
ncbi:MAG: DUF6544 family protein [Anaerolineae bacterium]